MKGIGGYLKLEWWNANNTSFRSEHTAAFCGEYQSVKTKSNEQNINKLLENKEINKNQKFICKYYIVIDK